jgi:hypothetical protein
MEHKRSFLNQIIASTSLDGHGERRDKQFFEALIASYPPRMPLHQQHDMKKKTLGYLENFRLVEDRNNEGEWVVVADVFIDSEDIDEALRGFSFSFFEPMKGNMDNHQYAVFLPYPYYKDEAFIDELLSNDDQLMVGRFVKKNLQADTVVALIIGAVQFLLGPEWELTYKQYIRPRITHFFSKIPHLAQKNISVDYLQPVKYAGKDVEVLFIPERTRLEETLSEPLIFEGLSTAYAYLDGDAKATSIGVQRLKLYFDASADRYMVFHVQYVDGTDENII